jgi:hypothetical protein
MLVDEGIYLFFESEIPDQDEVSHRASDNFLWFHWAGTANRNAFAINFYKNFLQAIKDIFIAESKQNENDEQNNKWIRLIEHEFKQCCDKIKTVWFIPVRSFDDLEFELTDLAFDLTESLEMDYCLDLSIMMEVLSGQEPR